jgi:hypothetical protein
MTLSYTTHFRFGIPDFLSGPWHADWQALVQALDEVLYELAIVSNATTWLNSTAYTVGKFTIDPNNGLIYVCKVAHTSAASPTLFAADRATNPTFWTSLLEISLGPDLSAIEALLTTGLATRTAADTWTTRSLAQPAAGITITNPAGVAGNPTLVLANDLAALEALASSGFSARTGTDAWAIRTLTAPAEGLTITNNAGTAGNPTFSFSNDLGAIEALNTNGILARTGTDTWAARTLSAPVEGLTISNPAGAAGNPTFALANDLAALEALNSNGIIVRTTTDTFLNRTLTQPGTGLTITNNGGLLGNPTFAFANDLAALEAFSGTGITGWPYRSAADTWATAGTSTSMRFGAGGVLDAKGFAQPGGRLTLQTSVPVMTTTQSAKTTIYWTPYLHQHAPLYDGVDVVMVNIGGEPSQLTTDTTKSPAAVAANSNYDLFLWDDAGTKRCTRGPAWISDTARGTGAGTSELTRIQGTLLNAWAITNGPAQNRGTFVGTVRSNASSQIDWILGAIGVGGTAGVLGVWNMYNRTDVETFVQDSTDSWTYSTATVRAANASNSMRVSFIQGLAEDGFSARYSVTSTNNASNAVQGRSNGIGYDSTSAIASGCSPGYTQITSYRAADGVTNISPLSPGVALFSKAGDIGWHFVQATEYSDGGGATSTWFGDGGAPTILQNGLHFSGRF